MMKKDTNIIELKEVIEQNKRKANTEKTKNDKTTAEFNNYLINELFKIVELQNKHIERLANVIDANNGKINRIVKEVYKDGYKEEYHADIETLEKNN